MKTNDVPANKNIGQVDEEPKFFGFLSRQTLILAAAILATALIVGGGMWWWMNGKVEAVRVEFVDRIAELSENPQTQDNTLSKEASGVNWKTYNLANDYFYDTFEIDSENYHFIQRLYFADQNRNSFAYELTELIQVDQKSRDYAFLVDGKQNQFPEIGYGSLILSDYNKDNNSLLFYSGLPGTDAPAGSEWEFDIQTKTFRKIRDIGYDSQGRLIAQGRVIDEISTTGWQTYRSDKYGLNMDIPQNWEALVNSVNTNTQYGISFRDKKWDGSFEWPGLTISYEPESEGLAGARRFSFNQEVNEIITIYFSIGKNHVKASCVLYGLSEQERIVMLDTCNQAIQTLTFDSI